MRLSAELYQQIVAGVRSDSQGEKDKRREPRVGLAGEADLITVGADGKRLAGLAKVRDVSPTGIGLLFDHPLTPGQRVIVQIQAGKGQRIWLVCHVAYSKKISGGLFSVGARIKQLMRAEQIQQVEAQSAATAMASQATVAVAKTQTPVEQSDMERISRAILG
jgi:hypothetical protein